MNIKISENRPGELGIICELSGRPITRSNEFGMFCDATVCQCEQQSHGCGQQMQQMRDIIKQISKDFGVK